MKKPKPKTVKMFDYFECRDYISFKLGYNIDDCLDKFSKEPMANVEYRNFWHFILDHCNLSNGSKFSLPEPESYYLDWQKEILEAFWNEFGEGLYWVEW